MGLPCRGCIANNLIVRERFGFMKEARAYIHCEILVCEGIVCLCYITHLLKVQTYPLTHVVSPFQFNPPPTMSARFCKDHERTRR